MKPALALAIAAAAATVATAVAPVAATPQKASRPCPAGLNRHPSIGTGRAARGIVLVNGAKRRRASLFGGNVVCTTGTPFSFEIRVAGQRASCVQSPRSALRVRPRPFLLGFIFGLSTCSAEGTKDKQFRGAQQTKIIAEDPVFSVRVDRKQTVVRVLSGSTLVSGESGATGAVVVGPGQAVHVANGGDPGAPTGIKLTASERALDDKLGQGAAPPDFTRPDSKDSPTLARIFQKGTLTVGIDENVINQAPYEFSKMYFSFLGKSWQLRAGFQAVSTAVGLKDLRSGRLDLLIASTTALGLDEVPLLRDANKNTWSMFVNPDKPYEEALRRFLVSMVDSGKYASQYRSAFAEQPSYEPLRPVLFPK